VEVPPYYRVVPPELDAESRFDSAASVIRIKPGSGFGDGTHETTQLCLTALGAFVRAGFRPEIVLDFGAGSGILAVAAALTGARVEAVEIDAAALDGARLNARLNGVEQAIDFRQRLEQPARAFDLVLANVLLHVLMDFAEPLCARVSRRGRAVLSGLLGTDVPAILARYRPLLAPMRADVFERGEWRAVVFTGHAGDQT
jgi:ribosomal protein L11 methyltransferase